LGWLAGIGAWVAKKTVPAWSLAIALLLGVALANSLTISRLIGNQDKKAEAVTKSIVRQYDAGVKDTGKRHEREMAVDEKTESDIGKIDAGQGCNVPASFFKMMNEVAE